MAITNQDIMEFGARLAWNAASDIINRFVFQITDTNAANDSDILTDIIDHIETLYDAIDAALANNATFIDLIGRNLTQGTVFGSFAWPTLVAGAQSAHAINPGLSVFAYSGTDIPNVQGRKWWAPFSETENDDGFWGASLVTAIDVVMLGFGGSIVAAQSGATIFPVIAHLKELDDEGELVDVVPPVVRPYITSTVSSNAGVLTRRRPGSGS